LSQHEKRATKRIHIRPSRTELGHAKGNSKTDMRFFESFRRFQARDSGMQCTAAMPRSNQSTSARDGNDLAMKQAYVYAGVHQGKE